MTNSLVPKPFDVTDAKRVREEAARLAERRDGAAWAGTGVVAKAVAEETVAREELAVDTEAEAQVTRDQVVAEALARAEAFIDVDAKLLDLDVRYDGVITEAGQLGTRLDTAEVDITAAERRLDTAAADITNAFGQLGTVDSRIGTAKSDTLAEAAGTAQTKADTALAAANAQIAQVIARGQSLVRNGDFEAGQDGWPMLSLASIEASSTTARSGTKVLALKPTATLAYAYTDHVASAAGRTYLVEFWAKLRTAVASGTSAIKLAASFSSKRPGGLGDDVVVKDVAVDGSSVTYGQLSTTAWTKVQVVHTIGVDVLSTRFASRAPGHTTGVVSVVEVDDVRIIDITEAQAALYAAAIADGKAVAAQSLAGTADSNATAALTMAGSKSTVYYDTAPATGTGTKTGDLWRQRNATNEIIAEWQWSGSGWIKQTVSGSNVSNMDIGFLTAGAATMSQALINKLVAGTASFQTVDVKNLFATTGTMAEAVITKLWTEVVHSRKITTDMMVIGGGNNLIPDPSGSVPENSARIIAKSNADPSGATWSQVVESGIRGWYHNPSAAPNIATADTHLILTNTATSGYSYSVTVTPGLTYRIAYGVAKSGVGIASTNPTLRMKRDDGTGVNAGLLAQVIGLPGIYSWVWACPDNVVAIDLEVETDRGATATLVRYHSISMIAMNAGELTVDGTVTAKALETELVLVSKIVAGDPASTHAEMSPLGFKVFAAPAGGGTPTEVVRLGVAATDDYFAVTKADGSLAATISQDGKVTADQLNAETSLFYQGRELSQTLSAGPRGLVGYGARYSNPPVTDNSGGYGAFEISTSLETGRLYRLMTNGIKMTTNVTTSPLAELRITYTYSATGVPTAPLVNSPWLASVRAHVGGGKQESMAIAKITALPTGNYRLLLSYAKVMGDGVVQPEGSTSFPMEMWVEDIGALQANLQVDSAGGGVAMSGGSSGGTAPAPAPQQRELYAEGVALQSYLPSGSQYAVGSKMYQGLSPAGYGNLRSMAMFNDLTGYLSGATITGMQAFLYFEHWYNNAGGTAHIGVHGVAGATAPGTYSQSVAAAISNGWPRPGGRWVDIPPSLWNGFKTGQYRGITLDGPSDYERYGVANQARLFIKYTK